MSRKGRVRLVVGLLIAAVAVAAIVLWPSKGNSADKSPSKSDVKASPTAPSATQQYFNSLSQAIKVGNLEQQKLYVAEKFQASFTTPMFPKGTTVTFQADTLISDAPNTGSIKATADGQVYTVLLVKELNESTGKYVWHISATKEEQG